MLRYAFDQHELVADFVARMIPHVGARGFGKCRAIGIVDDDSELIAGIVYHNLHVDDDGEAVMELSGAALPGRQWATRQTLRIIYEFPFIQCHCQMIVQKVLADNIVHLDELRRLGYELMRFPRLFGRHRDGVVALLTEEGWREGRIFQRLYRQPPGRLEEAA